jgi:catechol 2,3-dioxygenase-like lactoylglutathione lyase family enzyme
MKLSNVRMLVKDYDKCFKFYTEKLGFEVYHNEGGYGSFKLPDTDVQLSIFVSDGMAAIIGNTDKKQPVDCREKLMISLEVECVDTIYETLKAKGVEFISEPFDCEEAQMRLVYLRDPEDNLIEIGTCLATCKE